MAGSTNNPPDSWVLTTGTWNTDAQMSTSVVLSGTTSLQLVNTSVATTLVGAFIPLDPVGVGRYTCTVVLRADSVAAGRNIVVLFNGYQADRVTAAGLSSSSSGLVNGVLSASNTWLSYSGTYCTDPASLAVWGQISISKAAQAFNVYIDHVKVLRAPAGAIVWQNAATTSVAASTWTTVAFDTAGTSGFFLNGFTYATGTGKLTVYDQGYYASHARVRFQSLSSGTTLKMRMIFGGVGTVADQGIIHTTGASGDQSIEMSPLIANTSNSGSPSTDYQIQVWHNDVAGARNIIGSTTVAGIPPETCWQVAKIG